jgi:hypothetical protein
MIIEGIWLMKLICAHMLTDFVFQPSSWVSDRNHKHLASGKLYLHCAITGFVAWIFIGWQYWLVAVVITITHFLIDAWKSYQPQTVQYFLADQAVHLAVIAGCWYFSFIQWPVTLEAFNQFKADTHTWKNVTAIIFLTLPAGILIGQLTTKWRDQIESAASLANAGKWIGIIERIIIFIFVIQAQYSAIGLLVAAKGIIRFNEKDRPEIKTEYLVIGTLMSIVIAVITGLAVKL